jgi:hypothetical protein
MEEGKAGPNDVPSSMGSPVVVEHGSSSDSGQKRSSELSDNFSEVEKKRPRGPYDCLDWDYSEEEEFTPFTQEYIPPPSPKKSAAKSRSKKCDKSAVKSSKKKTSVSIFEGSLSKKSSKKSLKKSSGKLFCCFCYFSELILLFSLEC